MVYLGMNVARFLGAIWKLIKWTAYMPIMVIFFKIMGGLICSMMYMAENMKEASEKDREKKKQESEKAKKQESEEAIKRANEEVLDYLAELKQDLSELKQLERPVRPARRAQRTQQPVQVNVEMLGPLARQIAPASNWLGE